LVRGYGSMITGDDAIIHHAVGATGKHNKVAIGHWWLVPLTHKEHLALHAGELFDCDSRKEFEKAAFEELCYSIEDKDLPPQYVIDAIMDYHK